jgi:hypothetical protein
MRLKSPARDQLLTAFASRLNAGSIVIYPVNPATNPLTEPLIIVRFASPAFRPAVEGRVLAHDLTQTPVIRTGEAKFAELVTADGEAIGDARVRAVDDVEATNGDILLDRTDFQRGGMVTLASVTLSLPLQS